MWDLDQVDLRGCDVHADEWSELRLVQGGSRPVPYTGTWLCDGASFDSGCDFAEMTFGPGSHFRNSRFGTASADSSHTSFARATFVGRVEFDGAVFSGSADFFDANFEGGAQFLRVAFGEGANFVRTRFDKPVLFSECTFGPHAEFEGCRFSGGVSFDACEFMDVRLKSVKAAGLGFVASACTFGDSCTVEVKSEVGFILGECELGADADIAVLAQRKICVDQNRLGARARLRLVSGSEDIDLTKTILGAAPRIRAESPKQILATSMEFSEGGAVNISGTMQLDSLVLGDTLLLSGDTTLERRAGASQASVTTVASTDLADVVLANIDLSSCQFVPGYNVDKVRFDGSETFAATPDQWWRSHRRVLADEIVWRRCHSARKARWSPLPVAGGTDTTMSRRSSARRVAQAYRALRKSKEDSKDEPGAADFYYGEMEMRRAGSESVVERLLLAVYWAISGYGLRASRAGSAFFAVLLVGSLAMYLWGFDTSPQTVQGLVHVDVWSGELTYGAVSQRVDDPSFGDALLDCTRLATALLQPIVTLRLTTIGRFIEIALRFSGPLLLGLLVLSVRGRTKR
jgi:uncharacterized protein YjbI with pentapeptide repeats